MHTGFHNVAQKWYRTLGRNKLQLFRERKQEPRDAHIDATINMSTSLTSVSTFRYQPKGYNICYREAA